MDASKMANWLQIGANVGILVGLVLVGLQINQTSELLKLQLLYEDAARSSDNETAILGDDPTRVIQKTIDSPHELSFGEMRLLEAYHWRPLSQLIRRFHARELLGDSWKSDVQNVAWTYRTPFGRAWWVTVKSGLDPEIVRALDDALDVQMPSSQRAQFDAVKAKIPKHQGES